MGKLKEVIRFFKRPRNIILTILAILALIGIIFSIYYVYLYAATCTNEDCFANALVDCKRASYVAENADIVLSYKILGEKDNKCKVNVKLLQIKQGSVELEKLQNKDMDCYLPLGTYVKPEDNIKNCHGLLKESIQEEIIQRMHSQIIENIGQIGEELTEVI